MVPEVKKNRKYRFLINGCKLLALISALVLSLALVSCTGPTRGKLVLEAKEAIERADPVMGDWQGSWKRDDESDLGLLVAQVIAQGAGKYRANFLRQLYYEKSDSAFANIGGEAAGGCDCAVQREKL